MEYLHRPRRLLVTGRSGTGKTEYFIRWIEAILGDYVRIHIYDHEGEFAGRTGNPPVSTAEQLAKPGHIQCFDYSVLYPGELQAGLEFYADYVFVCAQQFRGQSLFCCDEMQKLMSTDDLSHDLACVIETGRRYEVDTVFVSQQINLLHNRVRNQVTEVVTFRQNDERAIGWLEDFGFDQAAIRGLANGEFICRTDQGEIRTGNIFAGQAEKKEEKEIDSDKPEAETRDRSAGVGLDTRPEDLQPQDQ